MIPAPYLMIDTALALIADMIFPPFSFDFNIVAAKQPYITAQWLH